MKKNNDTIVAQATFPARSGIGILRISGILAYEIAKKILKKKPKPRYAIYSTFYDKKGKYLDKGIALWFPKPNSFTGEDTLELQGHGSPVILNLILKQILNFPNTRIANPGEFSERAFLNGKIDLNQAEAIADLINSTSEKQAKVANNSLKGNFSKKINILVEKIISIRSFIEANIDFLNEKIEKKTTLNIKKEIKKVIKILLNFTKKSKISKILENGLKLVITGSPNVGKSSLFNALLEKKKSIVTNIAGTTRDVIDGIIYLKGIKICITDTAGLHRSKEKIELLGMEMAKKELDQADHIFLVFDASKKSIENIKNTYLNIVKKFKNTKNITFIRNKIDITNERASLIKINDYNSIINISTFSKKSIKILKDFLKKILYISNIEEKFLVKQRHLECFKKCIKHLKNSIDFLSENILREEILAEELRLAHISLEEITGRFTSDNLLTHIFSQFCIGK